MTAPAIGVLLVALAACAVDEPRDGRTYLVGAGPGPGGAPQGQQRAGSADGITAGTVAPGDDTSPTAVTPQGGPVSGGGTGGSAGGPTSGGGGAPAGGGAGGPSVGVTSTQITISVSGNFSGPIGQAANQVYESGLGTWVHDVNSRGGVHGRKIRLIKIDDKDTSEGGRAGCKEIESNGSLFAFVVTSNTAVVDCLANAGITVYPTAVPEDLKRPHVFSNFLDPDRGRLVAEFAKNGLGGATKKLGIIYVNTPQYTSVSKAFVEHAKALGMTVAPPEAVAPNQTSFTSELLRLKSAGAEIVAIVALAESIGILRDARAVDFRPEWTGVVYCTDEFSTAAVELFQGVRCLRQYTGADKPVYGEYKRKAAAAGREAYSTTSAMSMYGVGLVMERMLQNAGPSLNRQSLEAAWASTQYDNRIHPVLDWRSGKTHGTQTLFVVECCANDRTWRTLGTVSL